VSGSTVVSPSTTSTYTARAHKVGTDQTFTCGAVTVTVTPKEVPAPTCDLHAHETTIEQGDHATLEWTSEHADSAAFDHGVTATSPQGSFSVSPTEATTYTGTFTGAEGKQVTCSTTVTVTIPQIFNPWCSIGASPSSIDKDDSTTLWWDSNDVTGVDIPGVGTGLDHANSVQVSPNTTATYTGSFYGKDGKTYTCSTEVVVNTPNVEYPTPSCTLNVSSSDVTRNSQVTVSWTSDHASNVTIDQGIGSVALSGSTVVTVPDSRTFTGTFTSDKGKTATCSAHVSVSTPSIGGGRCINCGSTHNKPEDKPKDVAKSPNVVLSKVVTKPGYISLEQVPYTGFEAGPVLTMFFWLMVLALSAAIAYVVTYVHPITRLRAVFAADRFARSRRAREDYIASAVEEARTAMNTMQATVPYIAPVALSAATTDGVSSVEDRAHTDSILLSPEATRMITDVVTKTSTDEKALLDKLFTAAKDTYPREDGWILLSKERTQVLLAQVTNGTGIAVAAVAPVATPEPVVPVMQTTQDRPFRSTPPVLSGDRPTVSVSPAMAPRTATVPATANTVAAPKDDAEALVQFVEYLVAGEQQKTFDILRGMTGKGVAPEKFIGQLVRKLDDIYKNRLEGNHTPDAALAAKTATWSNGDFEKVLGILVECIDYSYSSTRIGTKVALAKAFEYFALKNK